MRPILVLLCWLSCASAGAASERTVEAVNLGWHVGLAFAIDDLDPADFPEIADFPDARWIEIGWGDAAFYRDPDAGIAAILEAAFASSGAVLHLVAMPAHPARYLPAAEVVAIPLDEAQFRRLVAYASGSVNRGGSARAQAIGPGLYPVSRFYPAHGEFSLGRTCNTWVAEGLAGAGLPIEPDGVIRAGALMDRIRAATGRGAVFKLEPSEHR